jgi:hypothetical protein
MRTQCWNYSAKSQIVKRPRMQLELMGKCTVWSPGFSRQGVHPCKEIENMNCMPKLASASQHSTAREASQAQILLARCRLWATIP